MGEWEGWMRRVNEKVKWEDQTITLIHLTAAKQCIENTVIRVTEKVLQDNQHQEPTQNGTPCGNVMNPTDGWMRRVNEKKCEIVCVGRVNEAYERERNEKGNENVRPIACFSCQFQANGDNSYSTNKRSKTQSKLPQETTNKNYRKTPLQTQSWRNVKAKDFKHFIPLFPLYKHHKTITYVQ